MTVYCTECEHCEYHYDVLLAECKAQRVVSIHGFPLYCWEINRDGKCISFEQKKSWFRKL